VYKHRVSAGILATPERQFYELSLFLACELTVVWFLAYLLPTIGWLKTNKRSTVLQNVQFRAAILLNPPTPVKANLWFFLEKNPTLPQFQETL
jgi:hypothetical protein